MYFMCCIFSASHTLTLPVCRLWASLALSWHVCWHMRPVHTWDEVDVAFDCYLMATNSPLLLKVVLTDYITFLNFKVFILISCCSLNCICQSGIKTCFLWLVLRCHNYAHRRPSKEEILKNEKTCSRNKRAFCSLTVWHFNAGIVAPLG